MNVTILIEEINTLDIQCKELLASNTPVLISIKEIQDRLANYYSKAKQSFLSSNFDSTQNQIDYFKMYYSKLISICLHYNNVQRIERRLLQRPVKKQLKILREEIEALDIISKENQDLISYITENKTHLDEYYFVLDRKNKSFEGFTFMKRDPVFSTHHSYLLGEILSAYKTLQYINQKLDSLKNKSAHQNNSSITLNWNRKKVDYVETIRALHAEGAFTDDLPHVFKALSQVINVGPLDHSSIYRDIKYRSNSRAKYLDKAAKALEKAISKDLD